MIKLLAAPKTKRFTRRQYYAMADAGVFADGRVELIDGEIVQMPSFKNPHVIATDKGREVLASAFGSGFWVRMQAPLHLKDHSEPEPDLAVVKGDRREFKDHPRSALLIVEVSDSTLLYDQVVKSSLYAREHIQDYWVVNMMDRHLEVYRNPVPDRSRRFGYRYSQIVTLQPGQSVAPLALPKSPIKVADLLP